MSVGETFGEEEFLTKEKRKTSIRCASTYADVYMIKKKEVENRILCNQAAVKSIASQMKIKEKSRNHRIQAFVNKLQITTNNVPFSSNISLDKDVNSSSTTNKKAAFFLSKKSSNRISNKPGLEIGEFTDAGTIYESLEKGSKVFSRREESSFDFNVKDVLYPDLQCTSSPMSRFKHKTQFKIPNEKESMNLTPKKIMLKYYKVKKHQRAKTEEIYSSLHNLNSENNEFEIPFEKKKITSKEKSIAGFEQSSDLFFKKVYTSVKSRKTNSILLNNFMKQISSTSFFNESVNSPSKMNEIKAKIRLFRNIVGKKSSKN